MYHVRAAGPSDLKVRKLCHILSDADLCCEIVSGGMVNSFTENNSATPRGYLLLTVNDLANFTPDVPHSFLANAKPPRRPSHSIIQSQALVR